MVTFMVDLYHDGVFASNPLRYLAGEHRVIKDINFEGLTYDNFFLVMRRLNKWFESYQYSIRPVPGSKLWKKSDLPKPLPPGERKLPGHNKSKCTNAPKPKPDNFYEIPIDEERKHGSNNVRERDQYQQAGPSVDEIPKYIEDPDEIPKHIEDPVITESNSCNKRKEPPVKKKSSQVNKASGSKSNLIPEVESSSGNKRKEPPVKKKSSQVNKASGSKSNLTPEEHDKIMDKEAFADLVEKDAENKAKEAKMWRDL
nr:hypothetical protein [Tanacetum cinerariifolium]